MANDIKKGKRTFQMIAKTLFGLEDILAGELTKLGARDVKKLRRSVEFFGDEQMLYAANLWCRTATRILKPINEFRAADENRLYNRVLNIEWDKYFGPDQTFAIDAVISKSTFDNSLYVAQKTKDAVADYFRRKTGRRPSVDLKKPDIRLSIYINHNNCTLALDSSGEPLFKRGYRDKAGRAPLNEALAAGIVMQSGWDAKRNFVDAMCGSGTIVIEAAMLARNIAPGLTRKKFGFMNWPDYDINLFKSTYKKARKDILPKPDFEIVGSDKNPRQIKEASANAQRAGIGRDIVFRQTDMIDLSPPPPPGVLIINPPYGERMSVEDINAFYHSIGDVLKKKFAGYDAHVFTGNLDAAKYIGLRTSRRIAMYNGPIECRLLKFAMYKGSHKNKAKPE